MTTTTATGGQTEVREVGAAQFEVILPLLARFENPRMRAPDWRRMLFDYPWRAPGPRRGFAIFAGERAVGFLGTIESERVIRGEVARFCNLSSWIVLPEYRARSLDLLRRALALSDRTLISLTPGPSTLPIFKRFGHAVLEDEIFLVPPLCSPAALGRLRGASLITDPDQMARLLPPAERADLAAHQGSLAAHLVIRRGAEATWVAATPMHLKHLRFALVSRAGDPGLFFELLPLVQWGFFRALGAPALAVDKRLTAGRRPRHAISWRLSLPRLYRPASPDITPGDVDGLYTELMGLRV